MSSARAGRYAALARRRLELLDQRAASRRRPSTSTCRTARTKSPTAIRDMVVRGAPAIGCAAAFGVALEALRCKRHGRFGAA